MGIRRQSLFNVYKFLKRIGYIHAKNGFGTHATILVFHRVNDADPGGLNMSVKLFEEMIGTIRRHHHLLSLEELGARIKGGRTIEPNSVAVTFDDGYLDNFTKAAPILKKYGVPATFFITTGYIGTTRKFEWDQKKSIHHPIMDWDHVRELMGMGFEIGAHTVSHIDFSRAAIREAREEVIRSKEHIERETGREVRVFAVPFGSRKCITPDVMRIARESGMLCCSAYGGKVTARSNLYNLHRASAYPTVIEQQMELDGFMTWFDNKMSINMLGYRPPDPHS